MSRTISSTYTSGITLTSGDNPVTVAATAVINGAVAADSGIYGAAGTAWVLTNNGHISETGTGSHGVKFAAASTVTNTSGGVITGSQAGIALVAGGSVTNASGGTISGYDGVNAGAAATVVNGGVIAGNNPYVITINTTVGSGYTYFNAYVQFQSLATGVFLGAGGAITNQSGGTISGYYGVSAGAAATVVNAGVIAGLTAATAVSTTVSGGNTYFNTATYNPILAAGVFLQAGGSVTNQSGGTIRGDYGVKASGASATVVNAGTIAGSYTNPNHADGVDLAAGGSVTNQAGGAIYAGVNGVLITGGRGTVINLGTIHSHIGGFGGRGVSLDAGGLIVNGAAGGTASTAAIYGYNYAIEFGSTGTDTLINYGTVYGPTGTVAVSMITGTVVNGVSGATGALIKSGLGANAVQISGVGTVANYGTINGNAVNGSSRIAYGVTLGGSGSVVSSITNLGTKALIMGYVAVYAARNATVTNAGTMQAYQTFGGSNPLDAVVFGGGTNRLIIDPGAVFIGNVIGGGPATVAPGGNTLVLGTANGIGTTTLEMASAAATGTLSGLGVSFVGFAAVTIDAGAKWALSGYNTLTAGTAVTNSGTLTVTGTLVNGGLFSGTTQGVALGTGGRITNKSAGTIAGTAAGVGGSGAGTLVNAGLISGGANGKGVSLGAGGTVTNQATATIAGFTGVYATGTAASVSNAGTITGNATAGFGIYTKIGGTFSNVTGGVITGYDGIVAQTIAVTVSNNGSIGGSNSYSSARGIWLGKGGLLSNQSSGVVTGYTGVFIGGAIGTVVNAGTISGKATASDGIFLQSGGTITNQSGGTISGFIGVSIAGAAGTVVNSGAITGTVTANGGNGIVLNHGGFVSNASSGSITGYYGVYINGTTAGSLSNAGIIRGNSSAGIGVFVQAGGTLTNQAGGTISGGADAVKFGASHTNRLVIAAGAVFSGTVDGGNTIGAVSISTLELSSSASAGTLSGLGSSVIDFAQVTIDSGAAWTLSGTSSGFATLTNAGKLQGGVTLGSGSITVSNATTGTISSANTGSNALYAAGTLVVVNANSIVGGASTGIGVYLAGGGTLTNQATGKITGGGDAVKFGAGHTGRLIIAPSASFTGAVDGGNTVGAASVTTLELASSASIGTLSGLGTSFVNFAQVTIDSGARWLFSGTNSLGSGATLTQTGTLTASGTFVNAGLISANLTVTSASGISFAAGGSITNQSGGTIKGARAISEQTGTLVVVNAGLITGGTGASRSGIALNGSGTIANQSGGTITGNYGIIAYSSGATITNGGSISGVYGVLFNAAGRVTNQSGGTISGSSEGVLANALATVVNAGSITGVGYGVQLAAGGTLIAQSGGIISSAGTAVSFGAARTNRLEIYQGASFTGRVDGGNTIGAASISTLELVSSASAGTLTSIGSQFTHFAQITIDSGAQWALAGTVTGFATLTNAGALLSGVTLGTGSFTVTNQSTGTISGTAAVYANGTAAVVNAGSIAGGGTAGFGVRFGSTSSSGSVTNQSGGVITGVTDAIYFNTGSGAGTVSNSGTISGGSTGFGGINLSGGGSVTNTTGGTITGNQAGVFISNGTVAAVSNTGSIGASQGYGIWLLRAGTVTNSSGGIITGGYTTTSAAGVYFGNGGAVTNLLGGTIGGLRGVYVLSGAATVVNAGRIIGSNTTIGAGAAATGIGVYLGAGGSVTNQSGGAIIGFDGVWAANIAATVANAGTIAGTSTGLAGVYLADGGAVTNQTSGTITGGTAGVFIINSSGATVSNAGSIGGSIYDGVWLKLGGSVANLSGGIITGGQSTYGTGVYLENGGTVTNQSGGTISDRFGVKASGTFSVATLNAAATVVNAGIIAGGNTSTGTTPEPYSGVYLGAGGLVSNQSTGTISGFDGIHGKTTAATVINAGSIGGNTSTGIGVYLQGGGTITGQSGGVISGGADAVKFGAGFANLLVVAPSASFTGTVDGGNTIGAISISTLELTSAATAGTLTGLGTQFVDFAAITIDAGANWTFSGGNSLASGSTLTDSGTLSDSGTFTNAGLVTGAATGVILTSGAQVTNQSGGTITGTTRGISGSGSGTVVNAGVISGGTSLAAGVVFSAGGAITNQSGGVITGERGVSAATTAATVINAGSIGGNDTSGRGSGVWLNAGGMLTNLATGLITGNYAVVLDGAASTAVNAGTITGNTTNGAGVGVYSNNGGLVTNQSGGVITGSQGVWGRTTALTVRNAGSIGGNTSTGIGVYLYSGGTVTNQSGGVISGGADAVMLAAGFTNRLVIDPGAAFIGTVDGGNMIGAPSISTLELASGASTGTLSGLGSQYIHFANITVDAGADWLVASGSLASGYTITDAGTLTNAATLGSAVTLGSGARLTNVSGGLISVSGTAVVGTAGTATVVNAGIIAGASISGGGVSLVGGAVTDQSGGTITGKSGVSGQSAPVTVVNAGSIAGNGVATGTGGVALRAGGAVTNQSGGTITGLNGIYGKTVAVTVVNAGSIGGDASFAKGVDLEAGGSITNQSGGTISGLDAVYGQSAALTVVNAGFIGLDPITGNGRGVVVIAGGQVTNQSSGVISAQYAVNLIGVTATLTNAGTIAGGTTASAGHNPGLGVEVSTGLVTNQSGGLITGEFGVFLDANTATLVNAGSIAGNATATLGAGVFIGGGGGLMTNQSGGMITGFNGVYAYNGEYNSPTPATVVNLGQITGSATGGSGILLNAGGAVTNASGGTISGGVDAVKFAAGYTNLLAIGVGAGFSGTVDGGNTIGGASVSTMELLSGASGGTLTSLGSQFIDFSAVTIDAGAVWTLSGANSLASGVTLTNAGTLTDTGTLTDFGTIASSQGTSGVAVQFTGSAARLIDHSGAVFVGGIVGDGSGNTIELASGGSAGTISGFGSSITNFTNLDFDAGSSWTAAGDATTNGLAGIVINGFTTTDTIEVTGFTATQADFAYNKLTLTSGASHVTLDVVGTFTNEYFHISNNGGNSFITEDTTPCYLAGTRIRTDRGEIPVEDLRLGDRVITLSGVAKPIKWIGRRAYAAAFAAGNRDIIPILFKAGALGDNVPVRDLYVSPLHAMFVDDVLIQAEHLVNGVSVLRCPEIDPIRYFHIELEKHDVIFAEGAPAETFVDCDSRGIFHNASEFARLYPDAAPEKWQFCAPRVEAGPVLDAVRRTIDARAGLDGAAAHILQGNLDGLDGTTITGWAFDPSRPDGPVTLELLDGDGLIARMIANRYRGDLEAAGIGDGRHGFELRLARGLSPHTRHELRVRRVGDGRELPGSSLVIEPYDGPMLVREARTAIETAAAEPAMLEGLLSTLLDGVDKVRRVRSGMRAAPNDDGRLLRWAQGHRERQKRVLIVDDRLPRRGLDAGSNAILGHIDALHALGWQVEFVASRELALEQTVTAALRAQGVTCHQAPLVASVEEVLRRNRDSFDLVYLHRLSNAEAYTPLVRAWQKRARVLYAVAGLHHVRLIRQGALLANAEQMAESEVVKRRELAAMRLADAVITHSADEAAYLAREAPGANIHVVPWALSARPRSAPLQDRFGVAFVGGYRHAANVDAVHFLTETVMPLVWQRDPDMTLAVVGPDWPEKLASTADRRVRFMGHVQRLDAVFDSVRLTVAPLRFGAGLTAKVLDSVAAGVPCVMTPIAAEGLKLSAALRRLVAETPEKLAALIRALHHQPLLQSASAKAGLAMIGSHYTETVVQQSIARAIDTKVGSSAAAPSTLRKVPRAGARSAAG